MHLEDSLKDSPKVWVWKAYQYIDAEGGRRFQKFIGG